MRPKMWVFNSVGRLGHDRDGNGGMEGRITVQYHFTQPGEGITLFTRTMTVEAYKHAPTAGRLLPNGQSRQHRRLPRRHRAGTRLTFLLMKRPPQRHSLELEQALAGLPVRKQ